jgi:hypothetical protein
MCGDRSTEASAARMEDWIYSIKVRAAGVRVMEDLGWIGRSVRGVHGTCTWCAGKLDCGPWLVA